MPGIFELEEIFKSSRLVVKQDVFAQFIGTSVWMRMIHNRREKYSTQSTTDAYRKNAFKKRQLCGKSEIVCCNCPYGIDCVCSKLAR